MTKRSTTKAARTAFLPCICFVAFHLSCCVDRSDSNMNKLFADDNWRSKSLYSTSRLFNDVSNRQCSSSLYEHILQLATIGFDFNKSSIWTSRIFGWLFTICLIEISCDCRSKSTSFRSIVASSGSCWLSIDDNENLGATFNAESTLKIFCSPRQLTKQKPTKISIKIWMKWSPNAEDLHKILMFFVLRLNTRWSSLIHDPMSLVAKMKVANFTVDCSLPISFPLTQAAISLEAAMNRRL